MTFALRKAKILQTVHQQGMVGVAQLAEQLQTSEMTIRRDLTALATEGLIERTHGGAVAVGLAQQPVSFSGKAAVRSAAKTAICRRAAEHVQDGDVVFLDCGSTVFGMCSLIRSRRITVVTNSLPVVAELLHSAVTLNLIGGEVDKERQAVHGLTANAHIARYRADKAFIGVDGLSLAGGLSANGEQEAALTSALMQQAARTYCLCDSSKLERDKYLHFAPLTAVHTLITDADADPALLTRYRDAGLVVEQAT